MTSRHKLIILEADLCSHNLAPLQIEVYTALADNMLMYKCSIQNGRGWFTHRVQNTE